MLTLLIVDDEPQIRRAVRNALRDEVGRVLEAETGQQGIDLAAAERPSLIVLDLGLPDRPGGRRGEPARPRAPGRRPRRPQGAQGWRAGAPDPHRVGPAARLPRPGRPHAHPPPALPGGVGARLRRSAGPPARARREPAAEDRAGRGAPAPHPDRARRRLPLRDPALTMSSWGGRRRRAWLLWTVVLIAVTATLTWQRGLLDPTHAVLLYLLVVLGGSASGGGRPLGFGLALACFLLIDYFIQEPYGTLSVSKPLDWLELLAFLITAAVATELRGRANAEAAAARRHAEEVDRLSQERARLVAAAEH